MKELALGFLPEIYTLRRAINSISQRYFDGQQTLFPEVAEGFENLLALMEKTVGIYNEDLAGSIERADRLLAEGRDGQGDSPLTLDTAVLNQKIEKPAISLGTYLVDMAKAEALDILGENRQAIELVERHV